MSRECNHAVSRVDRSQNKVVTVTVSKSECPHCLGVRIVELTEENKRLREALEWYADPLNYGITHSPHGCELWEVMPDGDDERPEQRAQKALKGGGE